MVKRPRGTLLQSLAIGPRAKGAVQVQLCASLRDLVLSGGLAAGERIPASRVLAKELGLARATVVAAFEQLVSEGLIESRVGAGSFVSAAVAAETPERRACAPVTGATDGAKLATLMTAAAERFADRLPHVPRAFTTAMPALDAFPMGQWARLVARHWRSSRREVLGYGDPHGYADLRRAIARHLKTNRGIDCDASQVFIVAGAQHGFQMIASLLIDPGDKVWFENPGAIGARNSLVLHGAHLVPVPVDEEGLVVATGLSRARDFRLAFVTPSHQQPLGVKLSLERRLALLQAAERVGAWVIEDDWDGEFCFGGRPLPALKAFDTRGRVIYVGTFSKSLFPSIRLGFVLAPPSLCEPFGRALEAFSPGVPTSTQAVLARFMEEGLFATHIRRMRKLYSERYRALADAVEAELGAWLTLRPTDTGLHVLAVLKGGLRGQDLSAAAEKHALTVAPISRFCIEPYPMEGVVLGFSGIPPEQIRAGVARLGDVLRAVPAKAQAKWSPSTASTASNAAKGGIRPADATLKAGHDVLG